MTRKDRLAAMRAAGAANDRKAFLRLYVEGRVALAAANSAWAEGARFGRFVAQRDAKSTEAGG